MNFSKSALFSKDDFLTDISFLPEYNSICGFTVDDVRTYFGISDQDHINQIKFHYSGYGFGGKSKVINPISVVSHLSFHAFDTYWVNTGNIFKFCSPLNVYNLLLSIDETTKAEPIDECSIGYCYCDNFF